MVTTDNGVYRSYNGETMWPYLFTGGAVILRMGIYSVFMIAIFIYLLMWYGCICNNSYNNVFTAHCFSQWKNSSLTVNEFSLDMALVSVQWTGDFICS